jgi:transcriptional regulator with XRE-family HTH domain
MPAIKDWPTYVRRIAAGLTHAQIAAKVGNVSMSNIGRWLRGEHLQPGADQVIAFARAFDRPIMEALLAAGYVDVSDAVEPVRTPLSRYSSLELLDELRRRASDGTRCSP